MNAVLLIILVFTAFLGPSLTLQSALLPVILLLFIIPDPEKFRSLPVKTAAMLAGITLFFHLVFRFDGAWVSGFSDPVLWGRAMFFTLRNVNIFLIMYMCLGLLQSADIGEGLRTADRYFRKKGRGGSRIIQSLMIAMIYRDIVEDEFRSLRQMHRILGLERPSKMLPRLMWYGSLVLPLIASGLERSEYLGIALSSRGFGSIEQGKGM